jgi:hypothetical protein
MVPKRRFQKRAFDRVDGIAGNSFTHRTQLGVNFVADQLADGSRFRSLTVVDILGLTFF